MGVGRRRQGIGTAWLVGVAVCLGAMEAAAHTGSIVRLRCEAEGTTLRVTARVEGIDLNEAVEAPPGHTIEADEARASIPALARYLAARVVITNGGARCPAEVGAATGRVEGAGESLALEVTLPYRCARRVEALGVTYGMFFDVDPQHRGMASVLGLGAPVETVFRRDARALRLDRRPALTAQLRSYLVLGVEHIATGFDHLAFVLALLLAEAAAGWNRGSRRVVGVITAFTLAHSATLIASALGLATVSARWVEPAIALSVALVALENLLERPRVPRPVSTFGFGLLHGLGFAGALGSLGLPTRAAVASLAAFNVGVELGQLALVLAVFPLLVALYDPAPRPARSWAVRGVGPLAALGLLHAVEVPAGQLLGLGLAGLAAALASRRWGGTRVLRRGLSLVLALIATGWAVQRIWF